MLTPRISWLGLIVGLILSRYALAQSKDAAMAQHTSYRTVKVDGLSIFYREAGPKDAPTLLLLHGFPSSSRMFEPLFARLCDHYHLVAPDCPGFGHSDWPDPKNFGYTFAHYAGIMDHFTAALGLPRYTLYMQDYGGPVGFRMALAHPERVEAFIVQDAVAHNEGLGANWATRRAFWADRPGHEEALRDNLLSLGTTKTRHIGDDPRIQLYDPDLWTDEYAFLNAPGQAQIQSDLFYKDQGFEVVHASHLTPARKVPHPNLGSDVNPAEIYEWVRKHAPSNMEGVFIAGNGFRAIGVIAALEEDLGRPVLTGNQVAFWYALRLAGVGAEVDNYGQVFKKKPNRK
jgi:pimeloyl-ACP methyl ester carboxylesterase